MQQNKNGKVKVLEQGSIYFFYRPKVEREIVTGEKDVQRFLIVFSPDIHDKYRMATIGRKELPSQERKGARYWGYINAVSSNVQAIKDELGSEKYNTKTRGERHIEPARPAGEGVYRIVRHDDHTHLAYALELPQKIGKVQEEFNIEDQGNFIITMKNPEKPSPPNMGVSPHQEVNYPEELENTFRDRRFSPISSPELLDFEGAEFIIISSSENIQKELGLKIGVQTETEASADIFRDLKLDKTRNPTKSLFKGEWE
jgi:hypothetical protein